MLNTCGHSRFLLLDTSIDLSVDVKLRAAVSDVDLLFIAATLRLRLDVANTVNL
jgi:hypothetical protein